MNVPRPLILFLAFCGGAALFGAPLVLAALAVGGGTPRVPDGVAATSPSAAASSAPVSDEVIGVGKGALGLFQAGDGGPVAEAGH